MMTTEIVKPEKGKSFQINKAKNYFSMKKLYILLSFMICSAATMAQNLIDKHYEHFVEADNSTVVHVSSLTFQYAANFVPENEEEAIEFKEFMQSIQSFDLVKVPELTNAVDEYKSGVDLVKGDYDELLQIRDQATRFSLYIDEEDGIVYELVGIGADEGDFFVFSLLGEMRLDQIGEMINKVQSDNFSPLKPISDSGVSEMSVYPNPVNINNSFQVDVPEGMIGGRVSLIDANGAVVNNAQALSDEETINTSGLNPGYYFVSIEKDGVMMKKKILIVR